MRGSQRLLLLLIILLIAGFLTLTNIERYRTYSPPPEKAQSRPLKESPLKVSQENPLEDHHAHEENPPVLPSSSQTHPIHQLIEDAENDFQILRSRQSRSLKDAVAEYRRRYKLPPPPHFDKWYNFAVKRGVQLIDEYDTIYNTLIPFWALEPALIRERTREAIGFDNGLISMMIRNGKVNHLDGGGDMYQWHREAMPLMMKSFMKYLPDMDLAFNIHDEPRIVMQHSDLLHHITVAKDVNAPRAYNQGKLQNEWSKPGSDLGMGDRIQEYKYTRFNRFAHQPTWSNSKISCPPDSPAQFCFNDACLDNTTAYTNLPLGFIQNTTAFSDICNSPSLQESFGFFVRPNAFDVAHELFPIFSQSKVSSFQDILYPSPWYYMGRAQYHQDRDRDWEKKLSMMFWRGSTTGGFSRNGDWRKQHRQRFLSKVKPVGTTSILSFVEGKTSSSSSGGMWQEKQVSMKPLSEKYFNISLTFIGQCDPGDCDAQKEYFGVVEPIDMNDAFQYKYLLDIDGNAFSGRYHSWLQSRSLIYKLAIFREWHDEWLKPWLHYVPLSLKGDEYVESVRYFDEEESGKVEARKLADNGREWAKSTLRNDDLEVWFFRLLLEYGRLIDDNRYDIGFTL